MGKIEDLRVTFAGFAFRFRLRKIRNKRKRNGRTRGRYEGFYVYLEARDANGGSSDTYLGAYYPDELMRNQSRVKQARRPGASSGSVSTGKSGGQKDGRPARILWTTPEERAEAAAKGLPPPSGVEYWNPKTGKRWRR